LSNLAVQTYNTEQANSSIHPSTVFLQGRMLRIVSSVYSIFKTLRTDLATPCIRTSIAAPDSLGLATIDALFLLELIPHVSDFVV
jgi:hypothetical protein